MSSNTKRHFLISLFVIAWLLIFNYESIRYFYLQPFFKKPLPKLKFLFPPAGWIMFYNVDDWDGHTEVYGYLNGTLIPIDPHDIVKTRFIGFDMVHRNVLSRVIAPDARPGFCRALQNQFPEFERFVITVVEYPSLSKSRFERIQIPVYRCP